MQRLLAAMYERAEIVLKLRIIDKLIGFVTSFYITMQYSDV